MPTYDYECTKCGHTFEAFQMMSEDPLKSCPACEKEGLRRLIGGGSGIIFKGSGFYINDSRSSSKNGSSGNGAAKSGSSSDSTTSESAKTESSKSESSSSGSESKKGGEKSSAGSKSA